MNTGILYFIFRVHSSRNQRFLSRPANGQKSIWDISMVSHRSCSMAYIKGPAIPPQYAHNHSQRTYFTHSHRDILLLLNPTLNTFSKHQNNAFQRSRTEFHQGACPCHHPKVSSCLPPARSISTSLEVSSYLPRPQQPPTSAEEYTGIDRQEHSWFKIVKHQETTLLSSNRTRTRTLPIVNSPISPHPPSEGHHLISQIDKPHHCPYHTPILQGQQTDDPKKDQQQTPLDRFISLDPRDQPSLLVRSDNGQLSLSKNCTCIEAFGVDMLEI